MKKKNEGGGVVLDNQNMVKTDLPNRNIAQS